MGKVMSPELIRKFVDGELNAEELASFEPALEQDTDLCISVEFERKLRNSVMRAMNNSKQATPESLSTQIQDIFQKEAVTGLKLSSTRPMDAAIQDEDTIEFLKGPTRANFLAVAACLVIVAGAILFGIFGPNLLKQPGNTAFGDIKEVSNFVEDQHVQCVMDIEYLKKKTEFSPSQVGLAMQSHLGSTVIIPDLSNLGYELLGGGRCGVPPRDFPSGHIIYKSSADTMVGIFIQPNEGVFPALLPDSNPMVLNPEMCGGLIAWADDNLVYFVTLCDGNDSVEVVKEIRRQTYLSP